MTQGLQESSLPLGKSSECYLLFIHVLMSSAVKCVSHTYVRTSIPMFLHISYVCTYLRMYACL